LPGLMELIWPSAFVIQSIHVVARLGLADILGPEPRTIDELANATRVHAPTLRTDHPESVRAWALMLGAHFVWRPLGDLYESVRTGTPGFSRLYGERFFEWLKTHPEDGAVFNDAMTSGSVRRLPAVLAAYDFSCFERIVDVGGGHGALLAGILSAIPKVRGVLYDLPNVVAGAEVLRAPEIAPRCEIVGGDFFKSVPADGDGYILSRVIHDWDDDAALKILHNCREA